VNGVVEVSIRMADLIAMVKQGYTQKEIAKVLYMHPNTISNYLERRGTTWMEFKWNVLGKKGGTK